MFKIPGLNGRSQHIVDIIERSAIPFRNPIRVCPSASLNIGNALTSGVLSNIDRIIIRAKTYKETVTRYIRASRTDITGKAT